MSVHSPLVVCSPLRLMLWSSPCMYDLSTRCKCMRTYMCMYVLAFEAGAAVHTSTAHSVEREIRPHTRPTATAII